MRRNPTGGRGRLRRSPALKTLLLTKHISYPGKGGNSRHALCHATIPEDVEDAETVEIEDDGGEPLYLDLEGQFQHDRALDDDSRVKDAGEVFGEYTPHSYVEFSSKVADMCHHYFELTVDASVKECFDFTDDWYQLLPCFDLVDTFAEDDADRDSAVVMAFYKWRDTPILQIMLSLEKCANRDKDCIVVSCGDGPHLAAAVRFVELGPKRTRVLLNIEHATPELIKSWVGVWPFKAHMRAIFKENLEVYRKLLGGELTMDGLQGWYAEHRLDSVQGTTIENARWLRDIPPGVRYEVAHELSEEREEQLARFAMNMPFMQDLVKDGEYVETSHGFARADLSPEEHEHFDDVAARFHYFVNSDAEGAKEIAEEAWSEINALATAGIDGNPEYVPAMAALSHEEEAEVLGHAKSVVVVDDNDEPVGRLPVRTAQEAAAMTDSERLAYADKVAAAAGFSEEELSAVKDIALVGPEGKEEGEEELDNLRKASDKLVNDAGEAGLSLGEATREAVSDTHDLFEEIFEEVADEAGVSVNEFKTGLANFEAEAAAAYEASGVSQEGYAFALGEGYEAARQEMRRVARERGFENETEFAALAAAIERGAAEKAATLGMSMAQFEEYAWAAVCEAKRRDL